VHPSDPGRRPPARSVAGPASRAGLYAVAFAAPLSGQPSEGPGLIEILIVAGLIVLVVRFLQSRPSDRDDQDRRDLPEDKPPPRRFILSNDPWDRLRSKPKQPAEPKPETDTPDQERPLPPNDATSAPELAAEPAQTDEDFLRGAKMLYSRIAASLAEGDLEDAKQFCGPKALSQLQAAPHARAEIMLLSASLVEQKQTGDRITATVAYQALERQGDETTPQNRRSTWIFGKPAADPAANWTLDEIVE